MLTPAGISRCLNPADACNRQLPTAPQFLLCRHDVKESLIARAIHVARSFEACVQDGNVIEGFGSFAEGGSSTGKFPFSAQRNNFPHLAGVQKPFGIEVPNFLFSLSSAIFIIQDCHI